MESWKVQKCSPQKPTTLSPKPVHENLLLVLEIVLPYLLPNSEREWTLLVTATSKIIKEKLDNEEIWQSNFRDSVRNKLSRLHLYRGIGCKYTSKFGYYAGEDIKERGTAILSGSSIRTFMLSLWRIECELDEQLPYACTFRRSMKREDDALISLSTRQHCHQDLYVGWIQVVVDTSSETQPQLQLQDMFEEDMASDSWDEGYYCSPDLQCSECGDGEEDEETDEEV